MAEFNPNPDGVGNQDKRLLPSGEINKRESYLREKIGLSEQALVGLKKDKPHLYSIDSINEQIDFLKSRGFNDPSKMIKGTPTILNIGFENIDNKISGLKDRGFTNPHRMIEKDSSILKKGFENIDNKISGLKDRGFTNPHRMIELSPSILGHSFDSIDIKISGLKDRGFTNPCKMIEKLPSILTINFENIDAKIQGLKDRGFVNPCKMIGKQPASLLALSFDSIDTKISSLKDRGFTNPLKMIESQPSVLASSINSIDRKISFLSELNDKYKLNMDVIGIIESNVSFLTVKSEKLSIIADVLKEYKPSGEDIKRKFVTLYTTNLESLLISYSQRKSLDTIDSLTGKAIIIQRQKLPNEYKRQLIKDFFENSTNSESQKIYNDYLRAYPDKKVE